MEGKKNNKLFLILMIVSAVVLLAGIGVIVYFLLTGNSQETTKIDAPIVSYTKKPTLTDAPTEQPAEAEVKPTAKATLPSYIEGEPETTATPEATEAPESTPAPTEQPTEAPTATPAAQSTEAPEELPDSFTFGGVTIKRGTTTIIGSETIDGKSINGDSKGHFTHITKREVEMLAKMCPDLKKLDLDYCWFDTYEPLSALTKLEYLELKSCGTDKGGEAITDIGWVSPLVNLKRLNLCHNKIGNAQPLETLASLEWLNLGDNKLDDKALDSIAKLLKLQELYLYRNNLKDVKALAVLDNVTILNLANNKNIKTVKPLTAMKKLNDLRIYSTSVDDLSYFPDFKELKVVNLSDCPLQFSDYYNNLPKCPKLKKFKISKNDTDGMLAGDAILNDGYDLDYEIT